MPSPSLRDLPDPSRCPLCGQPNVCAMETERATGKPQAPCWCMSADIGLALKAQIPPDMRNLACICAACVARGNAIG